MITIKEGDLFNSSGLICHQVNCKGVMGKGVAKTFKFVFPLAYKKYLQTCKDFSYNKELLGKVIFCKEETGESCCMFAQEEWQGEGRKTDYKAFRNCCKEIVKHAKMFDKNYQINMPYFIGCGLGGGDWNIVKVILEEEFKNNNLILWKIK